MDCIAHMHEQCIWYVSQTPLDSAVVMFGYNRGYDGRTKRPLH